MDETIGADRHHPAKYWHTLADGRVQCGIRHYGPTPQDTCPQCGTRIAGCFGDYHRPFGPRYIPVAMHARSVPQPC